MAGALGSDANKGGVKAPAQSSSPSHSAVGSGSRPGASKIKIADTAPENAHTQGRAPDGWLK